MPKKIIYDANVKEKRFSALQQAYISSYTGSIKETCAKIGCSYQYGRQLATLPHIKLAIQNKCRNQYNPQILTVQQLQEFWSKNVLNPDNNMADRIKCSELLGKSLGGFIERVQLETVNLNELEAQRFEQVKQIAAILTEKQRFLLSPAIIESDNQLAEEIKKPAQAVQLEPAPPQPVLLSELVPAVANNSDEDAKAEHQD